MFDNEKENLLYWVSTKLDQNYQRKTLVKLFAVGLIGNLLSWLTAFFAPKFIRNVVSTLVDIEGKIGMYLLIIPFSFAFLMTFSICKLRTNQIEILKKQKKDFLQNYFENVKFNDYRIIFLISAMFGSFNAILLVFALVTFRR